jgi:restriction endonuclease-like protein
MGPSTGEETSEPFRPQLAETHRHEHRWFRALNSSQAFAVNLFGPVASDRRLARTLFDELAPRRSTEPTDEVQVHLEYTPDDGPAWLGERSSRRPTQVDVAFRATSQLDTDRVSSDRSEVVRSVWNMSRIQRPEEDT